MECEWLRGSNNESCHVIHFRSLHKYASKLFSLLYVNSSGLFRENFTVVWRCKGSIITTCVRSRVNNRPCVRITYALSLCSLHDETGRLVGEYQAADSSRSIPPCGAASRSLFTHSDWLINQQASLIIIDTPNLAFRTKTSRALFEFDIKSEKKKQNKKTNV